MNITYQSFLYRTIVVIGTLMGCCGLSVKASPAPLDSIDVTYENGRKIVIHQLEAKETYYGLSRKYQVSVKDIIAANDNKALKIGDTVRIPLETVYTSTKTSPDVTADPQPAPLPPLAEGEYTAYKVGQGETLDIISKRFVISIESIKRANGLTTDSLGAGSILKVPHKELPPPPVTTDDVLLTDSTGDAEGGIDIPANKYGIREMTERGVGVWIDNLNQESGSMLALHKSAPIGTVIKITNPMTRRTTFAKVVGKFAETAETKNAIVVISQAAASLIGVLDRRFQVEIAYGAPSNN